MLKKTKLTKIRLFLSVLLLLIGSLGIITLANTGSIDTIHAQDGSTGTTPSTDPAPAPDGSTGTTPSTDPAPAPDGSTGTTPSDDYVPPTGPGTTTGTGTSTDQQVFTRFCPGSQNSVPVPQDANIDEYCASVGFTGTPDEMPLDCMSADLNASTCDIIARLETFITALSALVGVVVVAMVALGGIQYSASRDNPQEAQAAKTKIRNALLALVVYIFGLAILQWLIPGGML